MRSDDIFKETRKLLKPEVTKAQQGAVQREVRRILSPDVAYAVQQYHRHGTRSIFRRAKGWILGSGVKLGNWTLSSRDRHRRV
jgi:hypothetical protein